LFIIVELDVQLRSKEDFNVKIFNTSYFIVLWLSSMHQESGRPDADVRAAHHITFSGHLPTAFRTGSGQMVQGLWQEVACRLWQLQFDIVKRKIQHSIQPIVSIKLSADYDV